MVDVLEHERRKNRERKEKWSWCCQESLNLKWTGDSLLPNAGSDTKNVYSAALSLRISANNRSKHVSCPHFDLICTFVVGLFCWLRAFYCRYYGLRSAHQATGLPVEPTRQWRRPALLHENLRGPVTARKPGVSAGTPNCEKLHLRCRLFSFSKP